MLPMLAKWPPLMDILNFNIQEILKHSSMLDFNIYFLEKLIIAYKAALENW